VQRSINFSEIAMQIEKPSSVKLRTKLETVCSTLQNGLMEMENKWWMEGYQPVNKISVISVTLGCCC